MTVEVASAVQLADLNVAVESLLGKGVEAIVLSINPLTLQGTPVLVQLTAEYGIPLYAPVIQQVYRGATIAAGFYSFYDEGVIAARLLHAYLSGEVDLADIAINQSSSFGVAINLDTAAEQGIEISEAMLARANFVIEGGQRVSRRGKRSWAKPKRREISPWKSVWRRTWSSWRRWNARRR